MDLDPQTWLNPDPKHCYSYINRLDAGAREPARI
jgi:hypothetical protein